MTVRSANKPALVRVTPEAMTYVTSSHCRYDGQRGSRSRQAALVRNGGAPQSRS
jgi:hypothetical protein